MAPRGRRDDRRAVESGLHRPPAGSPRPASAWKLDRFEECLDRWIEDREPPDGLSYIVTEWVMSRLEDPYRGVQRSPEVENLWYCTAVPGTAQSDGQVVVCSYFIFELDHTVRCAGIETLGWPVT